MAKRGELWDDSSLVNAFDDAISKYKIMHCRDQHGNLVEERKNAIDIEENKSSLFDDENDIGKRDYLQADVKANILQNVKDSALNSSESIPNLPQGNLNTSTDDYTQLLNKYYQLEEQKLIILQKLQQFGNLSSQVSVSNTQDVYPSENGFSSCCPYSGQCFVSPCSYGGTCEYPSGTPIKLNNEKGEDTIGQTTSKTELNTVLEAWFSAGFHTGKYEAEQAQIKNGK